MVCALGVIHHEAGGLFGIDGGIDEVVHEQLAGGVIGAAEGREQAAFVQKLERAEVDLFVAAHGIHEGGLVAGETRRVEDDHVILGLGVFEEIEDVVFEHFDFDVVEHGVVAGSRAGAGRNIDRGDLGSSGLGAGEGESALVGEAVEHALALGERGNFGVGLQLVEVEAGFLAIEEIDFEGEAVGVDDEGAGVFAVEHLDAGLHALGLAVGRIVAQDDGGGVEQGDQRVADDFFAQIHRQRQRLDGKVVAVAVDDQAGQAVGFAPDETGKRFIDVGALAQVDRLADAAGEEVEVEILFAAGKAAGDDLRHRIVDRRAERAVAEILERDNVARLWIAEGFFDLGGVNPLVTVKNACSGCDDDACHGAGISAGECGVVECETREAQINRGGVVWG